MGKRTYEKLKKYQRLKAILEKIKVKAKYYAETSNFRGCGRRPEAGPCSV